MMRQSKPMSEVSQVVTIVEEDLDTALEGFSVKSAGSASMGMVIPSDFNNIVETGQFQRRSGAAAPTKAFDTSSTLDASPRWQQKYRNFQVQSSFCSHSNSSGSNSSQEEDKSDSSSLLHNMKRFISRESIEINEDDCQDYSLDLTLSKFSLSRSERNTLPTGGL